jgi:3-deoxy-D-manno-octulosonate 8-phosphate phosphatase KdsC-like HAD superfamily phosphatase
MHLCIIPDLHNRVEVAKEIIEKENENVDEFIFLGDYFDDWNFFYTVDL